MLLKNAFLGAIVIALCTGRALEVGGVPVKYVNGDHGKLIVRAGEKVLEEGVKNDLPEGTEVSIEVKPDEGYTLHYVKVQGLSYIKKDKDGKPVLTPSGNEITVNDPSYRNCHLRNGKVASFQSMKEVFVVGTKAISITSVFEKYVELDFKVDNTEGLESANLILVTATEKSEDEKLLGVVPAEGMLPYKLPFGDRLYYAFRLKKGYSIVKAQSVETKLDGKTETNDYLKYMNSSSAKDNEGTIYAPAYNFTEAEQVKKLEFELGLKKTGGNNGGGTAIYTASINDLEVFPNPFSDYISLKGLRGESRVSLVDAIGNMVLCYPTHGATEISINTTDIPAGVYLIVVENGSSRFAYKVVK